MAIFRKMNLEASKFNGGKGEWGGGGVLLSVPKKCQVVNPPSVRGCPKASGGVFCTSNYTEFLRAK